MPATSNDLLILDPWLSEQLGCPAFRVPEDVEPAAVDAIGGRCFAFGKVPVENIARAQRFEAAGFRLVDTNVVFEKARDEHAVAMPAHVRDARPGDEAAVVAIAATSFRWTRFHRDPEIPPACAHAIKAAWAQNYFHGLRGDACLVAECDGAVAGFLHALDGGAIVTTDLVACDTRMQRRGLARALLTALECRFPGAQRFRVGTQLANVPSLALYASLGYSVSSSAYVFHLHRDSV